MMRYQHNNTPTKSRFQLSKTYLCLSAFSLQLSSLLSLKNSKRSQQGSALILLIAVILIGAALSAGIVSMTTTSTFTGLTYNPSDQARYLAQSGLEYVRSEPPGFESFDETVFSLENGEFKLTVTEDNGEYDITSIAWIHKGTNREASFKVTYEGYAPANGNENNNAPLPTTILNRAHLQETTGLSWGADGDTGLTEIVFENLTISSETGNIYSRDQGVNDGLGIGGGDGGLSNGQSVIFSFNSLFNSYSLTFKKFGNNSTARVEGFNGAEKIGEHSYYGSGGESSVENYSGREFIDANNNVSSFDKLVVTSLTNNAFFVYSIAADF